MFEYIIKKEKKDVELVLELKPEAPISLSLYKGVFNKTSIRPSNHNILGLIENILGIHLPHDMRVDIVKKYKLKCSKRDNAKLFVSVIEDSVDILDIELPKTYEKFIDSYSYLVKRLGEKSHINGMKNCDVGLIYHKKDDLVLSKHKEKIPTFYSSLYKKEYFITNDVYKIKILTTSKIKELLELNLDQTSSYYLGNSDGIITVKIL
jgi:hypothetical protein